jgi:hypothetical protein
MSILWEKLIDCKDEIIKIFESNATEIQEPGLDKFNQPSNGWVNRVWANEHVRRAHIDVVDARDTKKLWMMHVCVFPVLDNNGPIYGFDVISGANKMTGAFHDFSASSGGADHYMIDAFRNSVKDFVPTRQRELPDWAKAIFSDSMLAAGNVKTEEEAVAIIDICLKNLRYYFEEIGNSAKTADSELTLERQNFYCENQRKNPHTANVMKSLGLDPEDVEVFCKELLFPDVV